MRRPLVLLLALAACRDVPLPSEPTLRAPGSSVMRAISNVDWVRSSTGYEMIEIGQFNGGNTWASAINDAGQVAGQYLTGPTVGGKQRAFAWENGQFTDLGTLGGSVSIATGIGNSGVIVGFAFDADEVGHPAVWEKQDGAWTMRELPGLVASPSREGFAQAINDAGDIVGAATSSDGQRHAVKWPASGGTPIDLGVLAGFSSSSAFGINSSGAILGESYDPTTIQATSWTGNTPGAMTLPSIGGFTELAVGSSPLLNDAGDFVGWNLNAENTVISAYVFRNGAFLALPPLLPQSNFTRATGISQAGDVAGYSDGRAVVWSRSGGNPRDLGVAPVDGFNGQATGINNRGLIVGTSTTLTAGVAKDGIAIWRYMSDDASPPVIAPSVAGSLGNAGWYVSNAQVSWSATDAESGIASSTGCGTTTISADTPGQTLTCSALNGAGLSAQASVSVKRDATAPSIGYSAHPASYTVDQTIAIDCAASDATSGLATDGCVDIAGDAYTFALGPNSFTSSATDRAGNSASASTSFAVIVNFPSLANLTRRFSTDRRAADAMVKFLVEAEDARAHGKTKPAQKAIEDYIAAVKKQTGKSLTATQAAVLTKLARAL